MDESAPGQAAALLIDAFQSQAARAPRAAGVYLMKDGDGRILYVGKSVDIRSREASSRYLRTVKRAGDALSGFDPFFLRYIETIRQSEAERQAFEKAAWYQIMLQRYRASISRQLFLDRFQRHGLIMRERGRWPNTFEFFRGRLMRRNGGMTPVDELFAESGEPAGKTSPGPGLSRRSRINSRAHLARDARRRTF